MHAKRIICIVIAMLLVFVTLLNAGCASVTKPAENNQPQKQQGDFTEAAKILSASEFSGREVPLTDLASTYEGEVTDDDGNLLVPYDVAYPEAFADAEYNQELILLKMAKGYDGALTEDLRKCGVVSMDKFFSTENGTWYRAWLNDTIGTKNAVMKARSLSAVLIADYDYTYKTGDVTEVDTDLAPEDTVINRVVPEVRQNSLVGDQWYLDACGLQEAWRFLQSNNIPAGGLPSVVVAVIDTGVDYNHPDLAANMWVNPGEIPGNGIDDDGNGYIDDIHGASTVGGTRDHTGDPMDDHGHGTHVAGIIAASNNKEGVVGIAYNAKIMAVKAGQASGYFNQSDVAEAILYAYEMGADVINMSFAGTDSTIVVQEALQAAYTRCTLVAAAGNNGEGNEPGVGYCYYPAGFSYVIGVMSSDIYGQPSDFSNWDVIPFNEREYEVYAPGEMILSTLPNGKYGYLSGTSMSAPIVSGIAALLRSYFTDRDVYTSRFIAGQIASTGEVIVTTTGEGMVTNAYSAMTKLPKPKIALYDFYILDNDDSIVDAGDEIDVGLVIHNAWGMSSDTVVTLDAKSDLGIANPYVEIINGTVNLESVGTYSTKSMMTRDEYGVINGIENPFKFKIAKNCPNDYTIKLNVNITYNNGLDDTDNTAYSYKDVIEFEVRNGLVVTGTISSDQTWTKDNYYIIPTSLYIPEGVTVTVEPGTQIQFWTADANDPYADKYRAQIVVGGKFITNGTLDEPVKMFPSDLYSYDIVKVTVLKDSKGEIDLNYTTVTNPCLDNITADHCYFYTNYERPFYVDLRIVQLDYQNSGDWRIYRITSRLTTNSVIDLALDPFGISQFICGAFDSCVIRDTLINGTGTGNGLIFSAPNLSFNSCIFINNRGTLGFYSAGLPDKQTSDGTCHLMITDAETYFSGFSLSYLSEIFDARYYYMFYLKKELLEKEIEHRRAFAEYLGGDLLCFETREEIDYLEENDKLNLDNVYGSILPVDITELYEQYKGQGRITVNELTWMNGTKTTYPIEIDFSNVQGNENGYLMACLGASEYLDKINFNVQLIDSVGGNNFLAEIPNKTDGSEWTAQELVRKYADFRFETDINVKNSAILNDFNETNINNWLTFEVDNLGNNPYGFESNGSGKINVSNNYWGTVDPKMVELMIWDFDDDQTLPNYYPYPILTTAPENVWPFVVDAYLLNSNGERVYTVGNEKVTFVVEFNRDMDTTKALRVRFGAALPYAEYEIPGEWVTPRRWEGEYTLRTIIENGTQFFNISGGAAADDKFMTLYDEPARFSFEIDTTAAMSMNLRAFANDTGIKLEWDQDDYETLMGYNVYRSTSEDGYYERLNSTVIPVGDEEFFDDTIEPGEMYYYNFTVVLTDLSESTPSGKTVIRAKDTMAPNIYHTPVRTAYTGSNLIINATVTDNLAVQGAKVYYRTVGETEWRSTAMTALNDKYSAIISAELLSLDGLEYYIEATDGISVTRKGSADAPYSVTVQLAVDPNSKGDVDGDGAITMLDALMILQAVNDLLNLTEEQFMRADLNGDGELSAAEALRIMKYVNGSVTTILD